MASLLIDSGPLVSVVVASRNAQLRKSIEEQLLSQQWRVSLAGDGTVMMDLLRQHKSSGCVLLVDSAMPELDQNLIAQRFPRVQTLLMNSQTGQALLGADRTAISTRLVHLMNSRGAGARSKDSNSTAIHSLRDPNRRKLRGMIGNSAPMQRIWEMARRVAPHDTTVLISGESGTGKDLLAQEIHCISGRRNQPFVVVNCSAIPESLLEVDLFGYANGAFTGAVEPSVGRFHAAHRGTLFLDEIGQMPLSQQSKLLRFLDERQVQQLGAKANLHVDVRVIAASTVSLKQHLAQGQFRRDLYHRLTVFPIHLPPLQQRRQDLKELALAFASKFLPGAVVSRQALHTLAQYCWPGNVRELRDVIEHATRRVGGDRRIQSEHIVF